MNIVEGQTANRIWQGSEIVNIKPTQDVDSVTSFGTAQVQGHGLQIQGGAAAYENRHALAITFLKENESTGEVYEDRKFSGAEVFNGAVLVGPFDKIRVEWTKVASFAGFTPPALRLRVILFPNQTGAVTTDRPPGPAVIDFANGALTGDVPTMSWVGFYDDDTAEVLSNTSGNLALGAGVGVDQKIGVQYTPKRRLHLNVVTTNTTSGHKVIVTGKVGGTSTYLPIHQLDENADNPSVVGPASTTRVISTPPGGLLVPSAIQLWVWNNAGTGASFAYWGSFVGV